MAEVDFESPRVLTFDCYGTLIDWEAGILMAMRPLLAEHGRCPRDEEILAAGAHPGGNHRLHR